MRPQRYLPFVLLAVFACQPADTSANAKQAIDAANAQWARVPSTGHADSIAEFYAADAGIMPPNMATMKGKEAIRTFFAMMNTMDPKPTLTLHADAVHGGGAMAMERGSWHWAYPAAAKLPPGMPAGHSGKCLVHCMQQNPQWLVVADIWSSDPRWPTPPAPPPPPARRP